MPKLKRNPQVTDRDKKILRFLWKWKLVTTSAIAAKFFPEKLPATCYTRLQILSRMGYVKAFPLGSYERFAWAIEERGFRYIRADLGELESKGFRSEALEHDFLTTAFHLGEWLIEEPAEVKTYSEQQLRRIHPDLWPRWVPNSSLHRPDGYTLDYRSEKPLIYAFETELSQKAKKSYEATATFYDREKSISSVLWLVGSPGTMKAILESFRLFRMQDLSKHNFLLREDFEKHGWHTRIVEGSKSGQSLLDVLTKKPHNLPIKVPYTVMTLRLLDTKKRPEVLASSAANGKSKISD